jgi:hypothetical protein
VIPSSFVLAHSPLTGPAAWGHLPSLLREQGYDVVVINIQDDDEAPFADRYVAQATAQISAAEPHPPRSSWLIAAPAGCSQRSGHHSPAATGRRAATSSWTPDFQERERRLDLICSRGRWRLCSRFSRLAAVRRTLSKLDLR